MSVHPVSPKDSAPSVASDGRSSAPMILMPLENSSYSGLVKGILAGGTEVAVDQPLVSLKNILQKRIRESKYQSSPSPSLWKSLTVRQLYGGALANGTGMSLITGVQMWTVGLTKQILSQGEDLHSLSQTKNLFASLVGGLAGAPIASWSEMLMDKHRENVRLYEVKGKGGVRPNYMKAMIELWKEYGTGMVTRGLWQTAGRDMGFVGAYAAGAPYFAAQLTQKSLFKNLASWQQIFPPDLAATIVGSIFAGVIGITLTHPLDTWKTQSQAGMKTVFWPNGIPFIFQESRRLAQQNRRIGEAAVYLFKNLIAEPYKGFSARFTRGVSAVTIFNVVGWYYDRKLTPHKQT